MKDFDLRRVSKDLQSRANSTGTLEIPLQGMFTTYPGLGPRIQCRRVGRASSRCNSTHHRERSIQIHPFIQLGFLKFTAPSSPARVSFLQSYSLGKQLSVSTCKSSGFAVFPASLNSSFLPYRFKLLVSTWLVPARTGNDAPLWCLP